MLSRACAAPKRHCHDIHGPRANVWSQQDRAWNTSQTLARGPHGQSAATAHVLATVALEDDNPASLLHEDENPTVLSVSIYHHLRKTEGGGGVDGKR